MKKYIIAALALFLAAVPSFAALPTEGDWGPTSIGNKQRNVDDGQIIELTGDVNILCTIGILTGRTLTIKGNGHKIINKVGYEGRSYGMFYVAEGGKLIIENAVIDGGADFKSPTYIQDNISDNGGIIEASSALVKETGPASTPGTAINDESEMNAPAIYNLGAVELTGVTIQNVCSTYYPADQGGSISARYTGGSVVHGGSATSTKMTNCVVNRILALTGAGVLATNGSNGKIELNNTEFYNCINYTTSTGLHGGVIRGWGNSGADITLTGVKVHHCFSAADGGAMYFPSNGTNSSTNKQAQLTFNGCEFYNNCAYLRGGALDICANLVLTGAVTKVHHNFVQHTGSGTAGNGAGGGISFRAYDSGSPASGSVNVVYEADNHLEVYGNKSYRGGGIAFYAGANISLENGSTFTLNVNGAEIYGNETLDDPNDQNTPPRKKIGYGGGLWMRNDWVKVPGDEKKDKDFTFTLNLDGGKIYSNKAHSGGGLFVYDWDVNSSNAGSIEIYSNNSTGPGGAMYLQNSTYVMNSGKIGGGESLGNTAGTSGGGIYVNGSTFSFNRGVVSYNTANGSGGGVTLNNSSTATFKGGDIERNSATTSGGGVAVLDGSKFTFNSSGSVSNNSAGDSGGGMYCNAATIDFQKGDCCENTAGLAGGGVLCLNEGTITFTGNIQNNKASRGGGIALNTGASFTMKGGIISGNKAECTDPGAPTTTYNARNDGFGGGVFLYNYDSSTGQSSSTTTTLTIDVSEETPFGLYGNEATIGGNDITTSGERTSVTIPNVKSMELADFDYKDAVPNWYEDYNAADANYSQGTNLDAATKARYADQLTANTYLKHLVSFTGDSHTYTNYLNLTLGYELLHIIITAKNLLKGESAMFRLIYNQGASTERSWSVVLTGDGNESVSKTIRNLNYGQYDVIPVSWQWNYEVNPESHHDDDVRVYEKVYEFTLTPKSSTLKTDEGQVVNQVSKQVVNM